MQPSVPRGARGNLPVENDAVPAEPREETGWATRVERWRDRAEEASARYQRLAETKPLYGLPLAFLARYTARQGVLLASAAAFRMFMWAVPFALLVAGILAGISAISSQDITNVIQAVGITGAASQEVVKALTEAQGSWLVATLVGLLLFLWGTRTLTRNLILVNAHIWSAPPKMRQKDILIISLIFAGSWCGVLIAAVVIGRLDVVPGGPLIAIAFQTAGIAVLWLLLIQRLPDRRRQWTDLLPGCLLFGFGLAVVQTVSRFYLPARVQHSSKLYGSLGLAVAMLAWLLVIGQLIVVCAVVNSVCTTYRYRNSPGPEADKPSPDVWA
jgi:membrane protein